MIIIWFREIGVPPAPVSVTPSPETATAIRGLIVWRIWSSVLGVEHRANNPTSLKKPYFDKSKKAL